MTSIKFYLYLFIILYSVSTRAQREPASVSSQFLKINLLVEPGLDYEIKLSNKITLGTTVGVTPVFARRYDRETFRSQTRWGLASKLQVYTRNYYNLGRRIQKGKSIRGNSGNYWGIDGTYMGVPYIVKPSEFDVSDISAFAFSVHYGLQRSSPHGFNFGFNVGLGVIREDGYTDPLVPSLNLYFGWILFRKP